MRTAVETDGQPDNVDATEIPCANCGTPNLDWKRLCVGCGSPLPVQAAALAETKHIRYLLNELDDWRARRLLTSEAEFYLRRDYTQRQEALAEEFASTLPAAAPEAMRPKEAGTRARPFVPELPELPKVAVVGAAPEPSQRPAPSLAPLPGASVSSRVAQTPSALPPPPVAPTTPSGWRLFFQENALKIVFALATVLVLAALRSMLAWEWMDAVMVRLIPGVPMGLAAMFWAFGQKTRQENPWAAFVYHGLTAALAGFVVVAANKYWFMGALTAKPAFLAASLAATAVAGGLLAKWREVPYLHLFQIGVLTGLYAVLLNISFGGAQSDFRPVPLGLFGGGYLLYAALCFGLARMVLKSEPAQKEAAEKRVAPGVVASRRMWSQAWALWAHLSVLAIVLMAALDTMLGTAAWSEMARLAVVAGLLYGAGAQALKEARMVALSGTMILGGGALWLTDAHQMNRHSFATLLLALSALALVLAAYNHRRTDADDAMSKLATAYRNAALVGVVVATVFTLGAIVTALTNLADGPIRDQAGLDALFALLCGAYYLVFARSERETAFVYAGLSAWGVALVGLLIALRIPAGGFALGLAAYGASLCVLSAFTNPFVPMGEKRTVETPFSLAEWQEPLGICGHIALGFGVLLAALLPIQGSLIATWLWTTATLALGASLYAVTAHKRNSFEAAYATLACFAYVSTVWTWRLLPQPVAFSACLAPFLLFAAGMTFALSFRSRLDVSSTPDSGPTESHRELWRTPLLVMALLSLLL